MAMATASAVPPPSRPGGAPSPSRSAYVESVPMSFRPFLELIYIVIPHIWKCKSDTPCDNQCTRRGNSTYVER